MADLTCTGSDKEQLVTSLAAIVCASSGQDVSADNINAVITSSGNSVSAYWAPLFASCVEKADGIDKMYPTAGGGGGGGGGGSGKLQEYTFSSRHESMLYEQLTYPHNFFDECVE